MNRWMQIIEQAKLLLNKKSYRKSNPDSSDDDRYFAFIKYIINDYTITEFTVTDNFKTAFVEFFLLSDAYESIKSAFDGVICNC